MTERARDQGETLAAPEGFPGWDPVAWEARLEVARARRAAALAARAAAAGPAEAAAPWPAPEAAPAIWDPPRAASGDPPSAEPAPPDAAGGLSGRDAAARAPTGTRPARRLGATLAVVFAGGLAAGLATALALTGGSAPDLRGAAGPDREAPSEIPYDASRIAVAATEPETPGSTIAPTADAPAPDAPPPVGVALDTSRPDPETPAIIASLDSANAQADEVYRPDPSGPSAVGPGESSAPGAPEPSQPLEPTAAPPAATPGTPVDGLGGPMPRAAAQVASPADGHAFGPPPPAPFPGARVVIRVPSGSDAPRGAAAAAALRAQGFYVVEVIEVPYAISRDHARFYRAADAAAADGAAAALGSVGPAEARDFSDHRAPPAGVIEVYIAGGQPHRPHGARGTEPQPEPRAGQGPMGSLVSTLRQARRDAGRLFRATPIDDVASELRRAVRPRHD